MCVCEWVDSVELQERQSTLLCYTVRGHAVQQVAGSVKSRVPKKMNVFCVFFHEPEGTITRLTPSHTLTG